MSIESDFVGLNHALTIKTNCVNLSVNRLRNRLRNRLTHFFLNCFVDFLCHQGYVGRFVPYRARIQYFVARSS